jgi:hypothetical protein
MFSLHPLLRELIGGFELHQSYGYWQEISHQSRASLSNITM